MAGTAQKVRKHHLLQLQWWQLVPVGVNGSFGRQYGGFLWAGWVAKWAAKASAGMRYGLVGAGSDGRQSGYGFGFRPWLFICDGRAVRAMCDEQKKILASLQLTLKLS